MNQTAANLIDTVLPAVPVRQWVLSFPMPLRFWLARRPALRKVVLGIFLRVVFSWARRQARLAGHDDPQFGAVCFHQMFGSSLNLNLHFHLLALDGYYFRANPRDELQFRPTPAPTTDDIQRVVITIRKRVTRALVRRGFFDSSDGESEEDTLFAIQVASSAHRVAMGTRAGRKVRKLKFGSQRSRKLPRLCAASGFFNLHAAVRIDAQDRTGLERSAAQRWFQTPQTPTVAAPIRRTRATSLGQNFSSARLGSTRCAAPAVADASGFALWFAELGWLENC